MCCLLLKQFDVKYSITWIMIIFPSISEFTPSLFFFNASLLNADTLCDCAIA